MRNRLIYLVVLAMTVVGVLLFRRSENSAPLAVLLLIVSGVFFGWTLMILRGKASTWGAGTIAPFATFLFGLAVAFYGVGLLPNMSDSTRSLLMLLGSAAGLTGIVLATVVPMIRQR